MELPEDLPGDLEAVLGVFAHYGFRKTSMSDLARAIGISRQALYNRHMSKEDVFSWAAAALVERSAQAALAELGNTHAPIEQRLVSAFDHWAGQYVDLLRASPHSAEIVTMAGDESNAAAAKAERTILSAIERAIGKECADIAGKAAGDAAFALYWASKGLMYKAPDHKAYVAGMRRSIRAVLGR